MQKSVLHPTKYDIPLMDAIQLRDRLLYYLAVGNANTAVLEAIADQAQGTELIDLGCVVDPPDSSRENRGYHGADHLDWVVGRVIVHRIGEASADVLVKLPANIPATTAGCNPRIRCNAASSTAPNTSALTISRLSRTP